jgi:hypothetical protein
MIHNKGQKEYKLKRERSKFHVTVVHLWTASFTDDDDDIHREMFFIIIFQHEKTIIKMKLEMRIHTTSKEIRNEYSNHIHKL